MTMQKIQKSVAAAAVIAAVSMNTESVQANCCSSWCNNNDDGEVKSIETVDVTDKVAEAIKPVTVENKRLRGQATELAKELQEEKVVAHKMEDKAHEQEKEVEELEKKVEELEKKVEEQDTTQDFLAAAEKIVQEVTEATQTAALEEEVKQQQEETTTVLDTAEQLEREQPEEVAALRAAVAEKQEKEIVATEATEAVAAAKQDVLEATTEEDEVQAAAKLEQANQDKVQADMALQTAEIEEVGRITKMKNFLVGNARAYPKCTVLLTGSAIFATIYGVDAFLASQTCNSTAMLRDHVCHAADVGFKHRVDEMAMATGATLAAGARTAKDFAWTNRASFADNKKWVADGAVSAAGKAQDLAWNHRSSFAANKKWVAANAASAACRMAPATAGAAGLNCSA